ncbi:MAG: hypothetical protein FJ146_13905 [Deltaproteobacteria bacterium]|nr:hypothetical protein [Deltaproteobacteria bacterium]
MRAGFLIKTKVAGFIAAAVMIFLLLRSPGLIAAGYYNGFGWSTTGMARTWALLLNGVGPSSVYGRFITRDTNGNYYVAGETNADMDGQVIGSNLDAFISKYDSGFNLIWTRLIGPRHLSYTASPRHIYIDSNFNVYIAGFTTGSIDGNVRLGTTDAFVTKFDSTGTKLWTRQIGATSGATTRAYGVGVDSSGNVFIGGDTSASIQGAAMIGTTQDGFIAKFDGSGNALWAKHIGLAGSATMGTAAAIDPNGNFYLTGWTNGNLDGVTKSGSYAFFVTKYDGAGNRQWTRLNGPNSGGAAARAIATDSSSNVYITGETTGVVAGVAMAGVQDTLTIKYNSAGTLQWMQQIGNFGSSLYTYGVSATPSGEAYISGYSTGGGIDGNAQIGTRDAYIVKYDGNGNRLWTRVNGASGKDSYGVAVAASNSESYLFGYVNTGLNGNTLTGSLDLLAIQYDSSGNRLRTIQRGFIAPRKTDPRGVVTDAEGNIYVGGYTTGSLPGFNLSSFADLMLVKFDRWGRRQWIRQLGAAAGKVLYMLGVAKDPQENILIAGYTDTAVDGNTLTGTFDLLVVKYDKSGSKLWSRQMGVSASITYCFAVGSDSSGNVYVTGRTNGNLDGVSRTGSYDAYLVKFDANGNKLWTRMIGTSGFTTSAAHIITDASNNIFIIGTTYGSLDGNVRIGSADFFITRYDASGTKAWTKTFGASGSAAVLRGAGISPDGNIYIAGETTTSFDGNPKQGATDFVLLKLDGNGTKIWSRQRGAAGVITVPKSLAINGNQGVVVVGETAGGLNGGVATGTTDVFAVNYDQNGNEKSARQSGVANFPTLGLASTVDAYSRLIITSQSKDGFLGQSDGGVPMYLLSSQVNAASW